MEHLTINQIIKKLEAIKQEHGNLLVNYAYEGMRISFDDDMFFIENEPLTTNGLKVKTLNIGYKD